MEEKNWWEKIPIVLSLFIPLLLLPSLLLAVKTNQDLRSAAIEKREKEFPNPFPHLKFPLPSLSPSPTPKI